MKCKTTIEIVNIPEIQIKISLRIDSLFFFEKVKVYALIHTVL